MLCLGTLDVVLLFGNVELLDGTCVGFTFVRRFAGGGCSDTDSPSSSHLERLRDGVVDRSCESDMEAGGRNKLDPPPVSKWTRWCMTFF